MNSYGSATGHDRHDGRITIAGEDGHVKMCVACVSFDIQCEHDVTSSSFLVRSFHIVFDEVGHEPIGYSMSGGTIFGIGRQQIRWWAQPLKRYEYAECHVVQSDLFDLIIGRGTIKPLGYQLKRNLIADFMTPRPGLSGTQSFRFTVLR